MIVIISKFPFPSAAILRKTTNHFQVANFSLSKTILKILHMCVIKINNDQQQQQACTEAWHQHDSTIMESIQEVLELVNFACIMQTWKALSKPAICII